MRLDGNLNLMGVERGWSEARGVAVPDALGELGATFTFPETSKFAADLRSLDGSWTPVSEGAERLIATVLDSGPDWVGEDLLTWADGLAPSRVAA